MSIEDQVREIAEARAPRKGLDPDRVAERALHYLFAGKCQRAPQAVEWAFHDLWDSENNRPVPPPENVEEPTDG